MFSEQWQIRKPAVAGRGGMVAAQHWQAAAAGARTLAHGGNAIDAAVATAFALNAVEPWMCGLGGNGYMVIWWAAERRAYALNFQGVVPAALDPDDYPIDPAAPLTLMDYPGVVGDRNRCGYGSIAVPGAVAGLGAAQQRFGRIGFDRVLEPAITLAAQGLPVDWHATLNIALQLHQLRRDPTAARLYLDDGCPPQPDGHRPLDALTVTLRQLADQGPDSFYRGPLAERLAADLASGGSAITADDLQRYQIEWHQPLSGEHRGARVFGADPSSGARRLLDMLAFAQRDLAPGAAIGPDTYRIYARALNAAFAAHHSRLGPPAEPGCTSHISVVDDAGNMVALTNTLLERFGSQVVLPSIGILMNNAIGYFDPRPGRPTSLEPGKRINSSNMCPTIAVRDQRALFAVGASGAGHIVPATAQLTALLLDYDLTLEQAMHTPRIEATNGGSIQVDPRLPAAVLDALAAEFTLQPADLKVYPKLYACPSAVLADAASGMHYGAADPSSPVAAACAAG